MKRLIIIAIAASLIFIPIFGNKGSSPIFTEIKAVNTDFSGNMPSISARSAIVIDGATGNILISDNPDEPRGMASTTKIMTALIAIENCDPDTEFSIPKEAVEIEGSSVYLKEGERLTLRELLYCLLLESGNDAAEAIAILVGGSRDEFIKAMNERADELGLKSTEFANPHGLSDINHKTTARELAIITKEAYQYPLFREIVATKTQSVRLDGKENGRRLVNHNKLLFGFDGAVGVKTGYTKADGRCLVSAAERDGLFLIAVTLDDYSPTVTHKAMLESAFGQFESKSIDIPDSVLPINNSERDFIEISAVGEHSIILPKGGGYEIEFELPEAIDAPIEKGDIIGSALIKFGDDIVYIINIEALESAKIKKKSFKDYIFGE